MIEKIPYSEYEKRPGINASLLKIAHSRSMAHVKAYMDNGREETDALNNGHHFHSLALDGIETFVVNPETYVNEKGEEKKWNGAANVCKAWKRNQEKEALNRYDAQNVRGMAAAIAKLLPEGQVEMSIFAEKEGTILKCRPDILPKEGPVIDLKSCASSKPETFVKDMIKFGYHIQAAFYLDVLKLAGISRNEFWFIAVESEYPYAVSTIKLIDEPISLLRLGRIHYRNALKRVVEAKNTGLWGDYGTHNAEDCLPVWILKELEVTA